MTNICAVVAATLEVRDACQWCRTEPSWGALSGILKTTSHQLTNALPKFGTHLAVRSRYRGDYKGKPLRFCGALPYRPGLLRFGLPGGAIRVVWSWGTEHCRGSGSALAPAFQARAGSSFLLRGVVFRTKNCTTEKVRKYHNLHGAFLPYQESHGLLLAGREIELCQKKVIFQRQLVLQTLRWVLGTEAGAVGKKAGEHQMRSQDEGERMRLGRKKLTLGPELHWCTN